jgi:hypothetical protein
MRFLFTTDTTMKEYNRDRWWIDSNYIKPQYIEAENLKQAIEKYQKITLDEYYINISKNAIKTKHPFYKDLKDGGSEQIGYVFTASMEFLTDSWQGVKNYIDLWTTIETLTPTAFI